MISSWVGNIAAFLLALIPLVFIHELGHFLAARWCGVSVERFSIGFGPLLWRYVDRRGTEYAVAAIPLGGYVKMLDEQQQLLTKEQQSSAFNNRPLRQRMLIVAAGPLANFFLAFLAYTWIFWRGVPVLPPVIGTVFSQSIAASVGITPGMQIMAVNGHSTTDWESVKQSLINLSDDDQIRVTVKLTPQGGSEHRQILLPKSIMEFSQQTVSESLGIIPLYPMVLPVITSVEISSAAEKAGLQIGDRLLRIAGKPIEHWQQVVQQFQSHPQQTLSVDIERNGQVIQCSIMPQEKRLANGQPIGYVGLAPQLLPIPPTAWQQQSSSLWKAILCAAKKTWNVTRTVVISISQLLSGNASLRQLSGPLAIAKGASQAVTLGISMFVVFSAVISVNLGVVNLLPLPVLDGGHLLFIFLEAVRGKPLSEAVQGLSYRLGLWLLILLMGIALFNDLLGS